jgi:hypothetical protein
MLATVEKRDHIRMAIESNAEYRMSDGREVRTCTVKELSASGMMLSTEMAVGEGAMLNVKITPLHAITPPLNAVVQAIRCSSNDEHYDVACKIVEIIDASNMSDTFP